MRVLLVLRQFYCKSLPIGGAERQALRLARKLIDNGVSVTVLTGQWEWGQPRHEQIQGVPVYRHFTAWGMFDIRGLRRVSLYVYLLTLFGYLVWHQKEYDLIHCHSAIFGASIAALAGRLLHKKTVVRAMASGPWGDIRRLREGERGTIWGSRWMLKQLREADCFVALNRQVAAEFVDIGVRPERIVHIPNGVDADQAEPKTDYALGHEITVTFVGRLHAQKALDILLLAFRQVREELPQLSWRLKLIGSGEQSAELQAIARQLAIEGAVEFLGQVDDPWPLLSQSDIFVMPSRSEGMSNALLEAMACGLPCIVTDIGGNNEVIVHRVNGLLVRPDDHQDLASALACLATDQKLRERLGQEALRTVEEKYSLDSVASHYGALYTSLLQTRTIAYVTQTFPALTQTFVYRETLALENQGFDIMTCAIWKPDKDSLSPESRHLVDRTFYVFPISWSRFIMVHVYYLVTHPVRYIGTLLFVLTRRGERSKNRLRTFFHFCEAVYLAPEVQKRHAVHIHAHFTINAASIALVLSRLLGISFSFTAHNIFFTDRILLRAKVLEARFIVAISEFSKQFLSRLVPEGQHKITVVHCGVSPEDFAPAVKTGNDLPLLLFVGQLVERKGAPVLIEACKVLVQRGIPFHCIVVGGGVEQEVRCLRQLVERYVLQGVVELVGAVPQERVRQYLEQADVFVLPCVTARNGDMDGVPVSLMEAMAMEIPTVSTYVSGIPELIENEQSGLLVPEKDPQALADALQRLLGEKELRQRLGENGRRQVQAEFNLHQNVEQLAKLFERHV